MKVQPHTLLGHLFPALRHRRGHFAVLVLIAVTATMLISLTDQDSWWGRFLDPVIGLATFLFAISVWYSDLLRQWEEQLPKRLSVHFYYDGQLLMHCRKAALVSEADIRQWGQQIGKQMNRGRELEFEIFFEIHQARPQQGDMGQFYKPYELHYFLSKLPTEIPGLEQQRLQARCLQWEQVDGLGKEEKWVDIPSNLKKQPS